MRRADLRSSRAPRGPRARPLPALRGESLTRAPPRPDEIGPDATEADGARRCLAEGVSLWALPPEARGREEEYRAALLYELRGIAERGS